MQLTSVRTQGFRNLNCVVDMRAPLSLVVGENNSGKSNLIDAIRLVLKALGGPREQLWVTIEDFGHDGRGGDPVDTFDIEIVFTGLTDQQRGQMVSCIAPSLGPDAAKLRLHASLGPTGRPVPQWFGGDNDNEAEGHARAAATYTYMHPLRDALADLRPGRSNRLVGLLKALIGEGPDRDRVESIVRQANQDLTQVPSIGMARHQIQQRLDAIVGDGYTQKVDLSFAEPLADRIVGNLRTLVGDLQPLELSENGLGYNNVLYMATLLAGLAEEPEGELHLLLVEEPEAHLHPQLQDLLTRYLETAATDRVQVIVTTHSPNLASATGVERITVMTRPRRHDPIVGRDIASFGLSIEELGHLRRFLDVTKASLLFARGVLLVEGIAEQLLVPILARALDLSLVKAGVAVINVGGLAFGPFAQLFHPERLPYRCALVTDADPPVSEPPGIAEEGGDPVLSATAQSLRRLQNDNVQVFLARRTFEWDLVRSGNWETALAALQLIKPRAAERLQRDHNESDSDTQATALLDTVKHVKGRFAQALTQVVTAGQPLVPPQYLADAIRWVTGTPSEATESSSVIAGDVVTSTGSTGTSNGDAGT